MKILLMAPQPFFQDRGTPIAVRLLAEALGREGHTVHLLVFHEGEDVVMDNVTVHRTGSFPGLHNIRPGFSAKKIVCDLLLWWKSLGLYRREKFDCVHAVEEAVFMAMINKIFFRVPYIYDMDSCLSDQLVNKLIFTRPLRPFFRWFEKRAVRSSAGVLAVCQALAAEAIAFDDTKTVRVVEDISLLQPVSGEGGEDIREQFGVEGTLVLYVGNLESYQGIDLLLTGFAVLSAEERLRATLVFIGGVAKHIDRYTIMAEKLKISKNVRFLGKRPSSDLALYLDQADALASPRKEGENTPMKIYSYMDSGKVVLATDIRSHTQVLDHSTAVLVSPDAAGVADGLRTLLNNPDEMRIRAEKAGQLVQEQYSREAFERKLREFYCVVSRQIVVSRQNKQQNP